MRSYRNLLLVTAAGAMVAGLTGFFTLPPAPEPQMTGSLSLMAESTRAGTIQVFFDLGTGYSERWSSTAPLTPGETPVPVSLPLPAARIYNLRLDPIDNDGTVTFSQVRVRNAQGVVVLALPPDAFVAANEIKTLSRTGAELTAVPEAGGNDPFLFVKLRAVLDLTDRGAAIRVAPHPAERVERSMAIVLVIAGVALALGLFLAARARGADGMPAAPGWGWEAAILAYTAGCILFSRRPDGLGYPQFWSEDSTFYFLQQRQWGTHAILAPQYGYLVVLPRFVAWSAGAFASVALAPLIYMSAAVLVALATAAKAASPRVQLPFPYLAGLAVVLVPNMDEIAATLTNAQWFGAVFLLLVCLSATPRTRLQMAGDIAAIVLFGLTGPFIVFFLPLFLVRAWGNRGAAVWLPTGVATALALTQAGVYWHSAAFPAAGTSPDVARMIAAAGYRTGGQLLGIMPSPNIVDPRAWGWTAFGLWLLLWIGLPTPGLSRRTRTFLLVASLIVIIGGFVRYRDILQPFFSPFLVQRYFYLPLLATFWLLLGGFRAPGWRRALAGGLLLLVMARNASHYRMIPLADFRWRDYAPRIERGETLDIPTNPAGWTLHYRPGP